MNKIIFYVFLVFFVGSYFLQAQNYSRWPNGLPDDSTYFPIAVWLQEPSNAGEYLETGVNLYVGLWKGPTEEQLSKLKTFAMPVICEQNEVGLTSQNKDLIVGWLQQPDEPDNAQSNGQGGYDPCVPPDTMTARYNAIRAADSTRPVMINLGQGSAWFDYPGRGTCTGAAYMYREYMKAANLVTFDIYPVTSKYETVQGNLWYVPQGVDNLRVFSEDKKPIWAWIETTEINSETHKPTPEQTRTEVWMALIHGARGIGYFCHRWIPRFHDHAWLDDPEMKAMITATNQQITELAPVLNSPTLDSVVTRNLAQPSGIGVDLMVKHFQDTLYIFAVGMEDFGANTATFTINYTDGITSPVIVMGEGREIALTNNTFEDTFDGYKLHQYKIGGIKRDSLTTTGIFNHNPVTVKNFEIKQNYPNPFNPVTRIEYQVSIVGRVELTIYNLLGQKIKTLVSESQTAGSYSVTWDGKDDFGKAVSSGIYLYQMSAGKQTAMRKMILIK